MVRQSLHYLHNYRHVVHQLFYLLQRQHTSLVDLDLILIIVAGLDRSYSRQISTVHPGRPHPPDVLLSVFPSGRVPSRGSVGRSQPDTRSSISSRADSVANNYREDDLSAHHFKQLLDPLTSVRVLDRTGKKK